MNLTLKNIGKKYNREWIFRKLSFSFQSGRSYAILGPNGSGKSTLLRILSGYLTPSEGSREYIKDGRKIHVEDIYRSLSFAAPYTELIEEFTLLGHVRFHLQFKPLINGMGAGEVVHFLNFEGHQSKEVRNFSSGMKQRLKLALAILTDSKILLLDEPNTNLDQEGVEWYHSLIQNYGRGRMIFVASNRQDEYGFCQQQLVISNFK